MCKTFVESHGHTHNFHYRTRFESHDGAVHGFDVARRALWVAFEIGDGLDVAGGHFHKYRRAPFGLGLEQHFAEFVLENILHPYVDGCAYTHSCLWRCFLPVAFAACEQPFAFDSRHTVEHGVESAFQT
jgi:hypothetical protein